MIVRKFEKEDVYDIHVQLAQRIALEKTTDIMLDMMASQEGYTFMSDDGEIIACVGLIPIWTNRAWVWSILSCRAGRHMLALTRELKNMLGITPFPFVEAAVSTNFRAAKRWMSLLGFSSLAVGVHNWLGDGEAYDIYMRMR